jgi:ribosomal protein S18 acetylase RimI-like enzyme
MEVEDVPAVYRLGTRCYRLEDKPYNYWSLREVVDHLDRCPDLCLVAVDGDGVVGFVLGDSSYEALGDVGHLEWIAVAPERRRLGVATQLVEAVLARYRELGKTRVVGDVASDNVHSAALARRHGFVEGPSVTFFVKSLDG